jgi:hypothetical protein
MDHRRPGVLTSAMMFGAALTFVSSVTVAAPNTGSGPQKTEKQCKDERAKCLKDCDQLIDIGDAIKRCKDRCTDAYIICTPLRTQPGGKLQGVRPQVIPKQNAPIMRRGTEGESPTAPPATSKEKSK